jgi:hypothetical protein
MPENQSVRMLPSQLREARLLPSTYNEQARTIEVTWGQGVRVRRFDWWRERYYDEELSMDASAVDMSRLSSGNAAVLDGHNRWSLNAQIGVIDRAWIEAGEGRAVIRLSEREDIAGIVGDIRAGIIRNISVGYSVQRYEIEEAPGEVPVYRAVEWQPNELSFVTVGADPTAATRSSPESAQGSSPCVFMTRAQARNSNVEQDMPKPASVADATRAANEAETTNQTTVDTQASSTDTNADGARAANPFRGQTLLDLAKASLVRAGIRSRRRHGQDADRRGRVHAEHERTSRSCSRTRCTRRCRRLMPSRRTRGRASATKAPSATSARTSARYRVGSLSNLDAVTELSEFKNKTIPDGEKSSITATTKGNIINLSRQAIINDDLGAFVGWPAHSAAPRSAPSKPTSTRRSR